MEEDQKALLVCRQWKKIRKISRFADSGRKSERYPCLQTVEADHKALLVCRRWKKIRKISLSANSGRRLESSPYLQTVARRSLLSLPLIIISTLFQHGTFALCRSSSSSFLLVAPNRSTVVVVFVLIVQDAVIFGQHPRPLSCAVLNSTVL